VARPLDRRRFLALCYRTWFGREPDDSGLDHHLASANHTDDLEFAEEIFARIVGSDEFRAASRRRLIEAPRLAGLSDVDVVGVGTHCLTATLLRDMGLRRFALPFDWIFSSPEMLSHVLVDDFKTFLARDQYVAVPLAERVTPNANLAHHTFYQEQFDVQFVFNHHDPLASDDAYAYLQRTVDRFRSLSDRGSRRFYVLLNQDQTPLISSHHSTYRRLVELLHGDFHLFINIVHGKGHLPVYEASDRGDRYEIGRFESTSPLRGIVFDDAEDYVSLQRVVVQILESRLQWPVSDEHSAQHAPRPSNEARVVAR
jgi:hypothetical protein